MNEHNIKYENIPMNKNHERIHISNSVNKLEPSIKVNQCRNQCSDPYFYFFPSFILVVSRLRGIHLERERYIHSHIRVQRMHVPILCSIIHHTSLYLHTLQYIIVFLFFFSPYIRHVRSGDEEKRHVFPHIIFIQIIPLVWITLQVPSAIIHLISNATASLISSKNISEIPLLYY